ncbi:MAG: leucyl/phenylalanyl-tRNA--protein transferase [Robiginitomaculum sp.]|nr:MAG: leucyl/phenylalanyl-tRNA--protein transferase [Robiginitomaculum sp.]
MSGVLGPKELLALYAQGLFPMADGREDTRAAIVDPPLRGILPLNALHIPRRLRRTVRQNIYDVRVDSAFGAVVEACAAREDTWISHGIEYLYDGLFTEGHAHCVECWQGDDLVGGLYGVRLGGAFFGESMFSTARDASKVALVHLCARLIQGGFTLLDTQFITSHLGQFGAEEIARADYHKRLEKALPLKGDFAALPTGTNGQNALAIVDGAQAS